MTVIRFYSVTVSLCAVEKRWKVFQDLSLLDQLKARVKLGERQ